MKDLYQRLGVDRHASLADIKKAYRKLARRLHPDVNPNNPEAEQRFREVQEAYAVLTDPEKRRHYDQFGTVGEGPGFPPPGGGSAPGGPFGGVEFRVGNMGDLGDLFGDLFGGLGGGGRARRREAAGREPLEAAVELNLEQAVRGDSVVVPVRREVGCDGCRGSGRGPGGVCPRCHGAGVLIHTDRVRVRIPAGVGDGDRVRSAVKHNGAMREVGVTVRVRPHPFFERKGNDVHTVIPVTFTEAYLGAEVEVGTVHGAVRAKIPPGTQSGQRFRLRGKGLRNVRTNVPGDHFYTIQVAVPRVVSPAGRELARRVADLYSGDPRAGLPQSLS